MESIRIIIIKGDYMKHLIKGSKKWWGRNIYITTENKGAGSFLEPPFSKTHQYGYVAGVDRGNGYQEYGSINSLLESENVPESAKKEIKSIIGEEVKMSINDPSIQDWIHNIMGYFNSCYSPDGVNRSASDCVIIKGSPFEIGIDKHLGVMFIREYYPEYIPSQEDFDKAYWGKK
jgi:hypothetical protein